MAAIVPGPGDAADNAIRTFANLDHAVWFLVIDSLRRFLGWLVEGANDVWTWLVTTEQLIVVRRDEPEEQAPSHLGN